MFIEMYGTPEYEGFDPTPIVAITYSLLFGMMFGDVGQGLCVILVGWWMYKYKKMQLGDVMIRIGIFSTIFGFVLVPSSVRNHVESSLSCNLRTY